MANEVAAVVEGTTEAAAEGMGTEEEVGEVITCPPRRILPLLVTLR